MSRGKGLGTPRSSIPLMSMPNPMAEATRWSLFAWQTGLVFTLRSAQLMARPGTAAVTLADMAMEKQLAFTQGFVDAGQAALRGEHIQAVTEAAVAPARKRVAANARALRRGR